MKKLVNLKDLMLEQLRDLYHGESLIQHSLDKMSLLASHPRLVNAIKNYQIKQSDEKMRLRQVFEQLFKQKRGEVSQPLTAMTQQFEELLKRSNHSQILDAMIVVNLQHQIHYKIAGYGAVCTYLKHMGMIELAAILHQNLEIEKKTDRQLAMIADSFIDREAIMPHFN